MFNIIKPLFIAAHQIGDYNFYNSYIKVIKNQKRPYEELLKEQEKNLCNIINYSYHNVPYYHALFKNLKLQISDIRNIKDLEKLPILTKEIINNNWDSFKPLNIEKMKYSNNSTGGTTGTPFNYRLTSYNRFLGAAIMYRGWGYAGYRLADKMVFLAGSSLGVGTSTNIMTHLNEFIRNTRKLSSFDMGDKNLFEYVKIINSFNPKYLRGYASSIYHFANWIESKGVKIYSPEAIFTTADQLFPYMRKKIEAVFSCPVFDGYGLNDGGVSAFECEEHAGYHIDMERSIIEVVDETSAQLVKSEGKILATSLFNYSMPFIRYDTGDLGVLSDEKCACDRPFPLLKELHGRSVDVFITPEGKSVHGWFFLYIFWKFNQGIIQYQAVQESLNNIVIYLVVNDQFNSDQLNKIDKIIEEKSQNWNIDYKFVDEIPPTKSGKHKFIINKMKEI